MWVWVVGFVLLIDYQNKYNFYDNGGWTVLLVFIGISTI